MEIIYLESIDSTNQYVKNNINNLADKTIVYTYNQTSGYGRQQRKWANSPQNNLYLTILLKPYNYPDKIYSNMSQYLSVVLSKILEKDYNLSPKIKWPNDILVNDKKISGILGESIIKGNTFLGLALGIGININTPKSDTEQIDKPATSILQESKINIDKDIFLKKLLKEFFLYYDEFIDEGFSLIKNDYLERVSFLNKDIKINVLGDLHCGTAKDVTDDGSLILVENGEENIYFIGDIL